MMSHITNGDMVTLTMIQGVLKLETITKLDAALGVVLSVIPESIADK